MSDDKKLLVQLGGGLQSYEHPEYESIDIIPSKDVKYVWDLEKGLPKEKQSDIDMISDVSKMSLEEVLTADLDKETKIYADNSIDEVVAFHVLEHIRNLIPLMDEIHDALKPTGFLRIKVPNAFHIEAAWTDPTHVRAFTVGTFRYWTHETIAAFPYTRKEWTIDSGYPRVNYGTFPDGTINPDDGWEIEAIMRPVKSIPVKE